MPGHRPSSSLARGLTALVVALVGCGSGGDARPRRAPVAAISIDAAAPMPIDAPPAPPVPASVASSYRLPPAASVAPLPTGAQAYVFVGADGSIRIGGSATFADARPVKDVDAALAALRDRLGEAPPRIEGQYRMKGLDEAPTPADRAAAITGPPVTSGFDDDLDHGLTGSVAGGPDLGPSGGTGSGTIGTGRVGTLGHGTARRAPRLHHLLADRGELSAIRTVLVIDGAARADRVARLIEGAPGQVALLVDGGGADGAHAFALPIAAGGLPAGGARVGLVVRGDTIELQDRDHRPIAAAAHANAGAVDRGAVAALYHQVRTAPDPISATEITLRGDEPFADLITLLDVAAADGGQPIELVVFDH